MTIELSEFSLHLGDFVEKVKAGEIIEIRESGKSIAELRPSVRSREPRPFGIDAGKFRVTDAFFEPLPEDLLRAFDGEEAEPPDPRADA